VKLSGEREGLLSLVVVRDKEEVPQALSGPRRDLHCCDQESIPVRVYQTEQLLVSAQRSETNMY
jgi:hypothetical protein